VVYESGLPFLEHGRMRREKAGRGEKKRPVPGGRGKKARLKRWGKKTNCERQKRVSIKLREESQL